MVSTTTFADLPALAINDVMRRLAAEKKLGPLRATARGHSDTSRLHLDMVKLNAKKFWGSMLSVAELGEKLRMFPNVKRVDMIDVGATNVEMHDLPDSLEQLDLSLNRDLKNIDFVKPMTSLKRLVLHGCRSITDIGVLTDMVGLKSLDVSETGLTNVTVREVPEWLEELDISCNWSIKDIDFVEPMTSLKRLKLRGCCDIADFSPLKALESLEHLEISENRNLENLGSLKAMSASLKSLRVSACTNLSDISVLAAMTGLEKLDMNCDTAIANFSVLSKLTCLTELQLNCCDLGSRGNANETLATIATLQNLEVLELAWNEFDDGNDILQLTVLKKLKALKLFGNTDIEKETIAVLRSALPTTYIEFRAYRNEFAF